MEVPLRENYRMTPIYRDAWDDSVLYFLSIDGHIYTVQVYADGRCPRMPWTISTVSCWRRVTRWWICISDEGDCCNET